LKLKPPLVFNLEDADFLVHTLDKVLDEVGQDSSWIVDTQG
jgi:4-aminobutyrate aminotransferase-like enzyme